jgi:hypothetical protein
MQDRIEVGTRIAIEVASSYSADATHEVTGRTEHYLLICPIGKLGEIEPGQTWVPVTRISPERVAVR